MQIPNSFQFRTQYLYYKIMQYECLKILYIIYTIRINYLKL